MDTVCNKKRVQDSISCPSQIDKGSASVFESNTLRSREDSTSTDRSKIYAGQTCHRTSFLLPSKGWLLQQALSGSQEVGRMETSNRSVPTKSACNHSSFQDGNFRLGSSFFTEARLGHFPRLDRCILSYTNASQVKEVSSFSLHGENIPVSSFAIRPGSSSLRVLQNCEGSGQTLSSHGHASTFLSRRLAPDVSISSDVFVSQRSITEHGFVPGICSQLGQIRASSQSEVFFSGSTFLSRGGTDRPFFGQVNKTGNLDSENAVSSISISQTDSFSSGSNGVYGSSPARWQSPQAYASVVHQGPLVSSGPALGFSHFSRSLVQQGRNPMAEQGLPVYHGATVSAPTRLVSIHGCESGGLGCPYGRSLSLRPMVCLLADSTHKCPGTQSSHVGSEILPSDNSELSYSAVNRQYDCSGLSEQRRGGAVTNSVFHGDQSVRMVYEKTGVSDSQVRARETKCSGRLAIQERADNPHRVDYPQGDSVSDISILGSPSLRSVCHEVEQSTSGVHFSFSRSTGLGSGCHVSFMGGNDSLCIPSSSTSHEGTSENGERDLFGHPHCTVLGKPSVFPSSAFSASCPSSQDSHSEGSFDPASFPPSSSEAGDIQPARLAVLQGGLEKAGFSKKSAERVCAAKRSSTQSLYNSRWNTWMDWCLQREMDPIDPTVTSMADFLIFLFEEKKLLPSSIKGYRSAIASTLKHFTSVDFSSHPVLSDVIRSMDLEKPAVSRVVPHWDLALVLDSLKKSPFEPLSSCSLKCLTQKTVFLIALASGRRRSEIHAFSAAPGSVKFSADFSAVELHFFPGFLAKNQLPSVAGVPIEIPALSGSDMNSVLCPVRALRIYMRRTSFFRRNRKRLFISYIKAYDKEICASTISRWIVDTVRFSYEDSGSSSGKICAHELRALSSSFAWLNRVPLDSVLKAGYWHSENSFIRFYLRDMAGINEKMFSLGPVVASQKVINS